MQKVGLLIKQAREKGIDIPLWVEMDWILLH